MPSASCLFWYRMVFAAARALLLVTVASAASAGPLYRVQDIGNLAGGANRSVAQGINAAGVVVGHSEAATGKRAFTWQNGTGLIDMGICPAAKTSAWPSAPTPQDK